MDRNASHRVFVVIVTACTLFATNAGAEKAEEDRAWNLVKLRAPAVQRNFKSGAKVRHSVQFIGECIYQVHVYEPTEAGVNSTIGDYEVDLCNKKLKSCQVEQCHGWQ